MQNNQRAIWTIQRIARLAVVSLLLTGCGPAKRAQWHLNRATALDPSIKQPRVVQLDTTIITQEVTATDTLVLNSVDSVEVVRERVRIQLRRIHDTIRVNVVCPPDTLRVVQQIEVPVYVEQEKHPWKWWGAIFLIALLAWFLGLCVRKLG